MHRLIPSLLLSAAFLSCADRQRIAVRLVGTDSCTTINAADQGNGLGPGVVRRVRSVQALLTHGATRASRCAVLDPQQDIASLSLRLSDPLGADAALRDLAEGSYALSLFGSGDEGCTREGALLCGQVDFTLPPRQATVQLSVHCYSSADDLPDPSTSQRAGPPVGFAACKSAIVSPPTPDGGPPTESGPPTDGPPLSCTADGWCQRLEAGNFYAVWGTSAQEVFVVGKGGAILRHDGTTWRPMTSPTTRTLRAIWGASGQDIWAGGDDGALLHYNGTDWVTADSHTSRRLYGLWGSSASEVYLVGESAELRRLNGTSWESISLSSLTSDDLFGIWGTGTSSLTLVAENGIILRNPGGWQKDPSDTSEDLRAVWGRGPTDIWAGGDGGTLVHFDGSDWRKVTSNTSSAIYGLYRGLGASEILAVGYYGLILRHDGASWSIMDSGVSTHLYGVWSDGAKVFVVGEGGVILTRQ